MSDTIIFIIGIGVFAITTTATLLYGYTWFTHKAIEDGIDVGAGWEDAGVGTAATTQIEMLPQGGAPRVVTTAVIVPIQ